MIPEIIFTIVTTLFLYRLILFINRWLKLWKIGEIRPLFRDILEILQETVKKSQVQGICPGSHLTLMFFGLISRIVQYADHKRRTVSDPVCVQNLADGLYPGTRGNIYDHNGSNAGAQ